MALTDNLVSYWKLDGDSLDAHASNDGTDSNTTYSAAVINNGAVFNGTTSRITVADAASLTPSGSFSFNFWVNVTNYNAAATKYTLWVGKWDETGNNREYAIGQDNNTTGIIFFYSLDGSGSALVSRAATRPTTGGWHMITGVFTTNSQIELFIDGVSQGTSSVADAALADGTSPLYFGNAPAFGGASNYLDGKIDETGLWSRVLTGTEITELYNSGAGLAYPFTSVNTANFFSVM